MNHTHTDSSTDDTAAQSPAGGGGEDGGGGAANMEALTDQTPETGRSASPQPELDTVGQGQEDADGAADAVAETPVPTVTSLEKELEELRDRHLRTVAEYENFRKRTARERGQLWARAQAEIASSILDALDDFGRVLDVDRTKARAADVIEGVELVERKLVRELEAAGLERVGEVGVSFDPNYHEAIGSMPAESEEQDQTIGAVFQVGYRFGEVLIRPAKVHVLMWQGGQDKGSG